MLWPMLARWDTYGFHDWDLSSAHRYITKVSLRRHGELPFWNPWMCGGFPSFGFIEGAPNLISPYLPAYLFLDIRTALRIEVLGTTATGAVGAYCFARRFTRSVALASFAAALFTLNGRWALQLASGHAWHLQFCWLPWTFFAFDRAQDRGRIGSAILAGAFVALAGLGGGSYPLPYVALFLVGYAFLLAVQRRSLRPVGTLAVTGGVAAGLAAPKLLPMLDMTMIAPRLTDSPEVTGFAELVTMLTTRGQRFEVSPVVVPYMWNECGLYIGGFSFLALLFGVLFARGPRENALRVLGLGAALLGFGAFHPQAPWALLHRMPIFSSLQVPPRVHLLMVLFLATAFVAWAAVLVDRLLRRFPWLDFALLIPVVLLVSDLSTESQVSIRQAFRLQAPDVINIAPAFEHRKSPAVQYRRPDWSIVTLLPMFANQGVLDCYGIPSSFPHFGARAAEEPGYQGMAEVFDGPGQATIIEWSPNRAVVRVEGANEGALVVYNMNYEVGWSADGAPAFMHNHRVAARLQRGRRTVAFRYRPRWFSLGLCIGVTTLGAIAIWVKRQRP